MKKYLVLLLYILLNCLTQYTFAETLISGNITENTTWKPDKGPYIVTDTIQIWQGATLTIEAGTKIMIKKSNSSFNVGGNIIANGKSSKPILFTSYSDIDKWKGITLENSNGSSFTGTIIENAVVAVSLDGISEVKFTNNIFQNNYSVISDMQGYQPMWFQYNTFQNNISCFSGIRSIEQSTFQYNEFINNNNVFEYGYYFGETIINNNNIIGNDFVLKAPHEGYGYGTVYIFNNWWGTDDTSEIDALLYDKNEDVALQLINYTPILNSKLENIGSSIITSFYANAGDDKRVFALEVVTLDGTESFDPYNEVVSYKWSQISGPVVELNNAEFASTFFLSPEPEQEVATLEFELTVINSEGQVAKDTCVITVRKKKPMSWLPLLLEDN